MILAKMTTAALLKMNVFWNKDYAVIIFLHDVINAILSSIPWHFCETSNHKLNSITIWPKKHFFEGSGSWFQFNNFGLAKVIALKFYTMVDKELKLKFKKVWELIHMFLEVTEEKLEGDVFFSSLLSWIGSTQHWELVYNS